MSIGSAAFVIPEEAGIQDDWLQVDVAPTPDSGHHRCKARRFSETEKWRLGNVSSELNPHQSSQGPIRMRPKLSDQAARKVRRASLCAGPAPATDTWPGWR